MGIFDLLKASSEHEKHTVVVFAPHPDDDVIGCGGTIIQHTKRGDHVTIVYVTSGEASLWTGDRAELVRLREQEAFEAAALLGVSDLIFLHEPDFALQKTDKTVNKVMLLLQGINPDYIYVPHEADEHRDHKATYMLLVSALKELSEKTDKNMALYCYEVWTPLAKVSFVNDISLEIDTKLEALSQHKTQIGYLNYCDAIKGLNRYRGIMNRKGDYAEAFFKAAL
jgi:LmbE family N-acetylglucosaminyl deacetylase